VDLEGLLQGCGETAAVWRGRRRSKVRAAWRGGRAAPKVNSPTETTAWFATLVHAGASPQLDEIAQSTSGAGRHNQRRAGLCATPHDGPVARPEHLSGSSAAG
jgi:hypothetical protein